jgi:hypothetical protein
MEEINARLCADPFPAQGGSAEGQAGGALARRDDDDGQMDRATAANGDMDSREPSAILASATEVR